jgi:predicted RNA-binding protein YlqC (UPF0109 family)
MKLDFDKKSDGKTIAKKGSVCEFIRKTISDIKNNKTWK